MRTERIKIEDVVRGSLAPGGGGAVVLDTLSMHEYGKPFWYDTDGGKHYATGGMLTVYVPTVRIHAAGDGTDGKRHALVDEGPDEKLSRGVCAASQGMALNVWESGTALAGVTCGGCRLSIGLIGTYGKRESSGI